MVSPDYPFSKGQYYKAGLESMKSRITVIEIFAACFFVIFLVVVMWLIFTRSENEEPIGKSKIKLLKLKHAIQFYHEKTGEWPDPQSWRELIASYYSEMHGYSNPKDIFYDAWGEPFKYKVIHSNEQESIVLYSCGQNQKDDTGKLDDILVTIENTYTTQ